MWCVSRAGRGSLLYVHMPMRLFFRRSSQTGRSASSKKGKQVATLARRIGRPTNARRREAHSKTKQEDQCRWILVCACTRNPSWVGPYMAANLKHSARRQRVATTSNTPPRPIKAHGRVSCASCRHSLHKASTHAIRRPIFCSFRGGNSHQYITSGGCASRNHASLSRTSR